MRENTDQKNSEYGHFLRSEAVNYFRKMQAEYPSALYQIFEWNILFKFLFVRIYLASYLQEILLSE